jgi:hypothetical protein
VVTPIPGSPSDPGDTARAWGTLLMLRQVLEKIVSPKDWKRVLVTMAAYKLAGPMFQAGPLDYTEPLGPIGGLIGEVPSLELYRRVERFHHAILFGPPQPRREGREKFLWRLLIAEVAARADAHRRGLRRGAATQHALERIGRR